MPRQDRLCVENGLYHVFTHGVDDRTIMRDDWDYVALLAGVEQVHELHEWKVLAFCVLGTHFHFLFETPHADLPQGMWRINIGYARWFNKRYGKRGHVFDRRYGARLIVNEGHALEVVRYIALNPCEAGVCRLPEEWSWSSYAGTLGLGDLPPFVDVARLLSYFGDAGDAGDARARLRAFVEDGLARRTA
jgi:REP element-mobilizing transposase RayT